MLNNIIKKTLLMGSEGLWALLISILLLAGSFSLTFWPAFIYVIVLARRTNITSESQILLVLGERLKQNSPGVNYIARLQRAYSIYSTQKISQIFIVGGITGDAVISESACGKNYLLKKNIPESIITIEDKSLHTLENIRNVRVMLSNPDTDKLCIITNRFHLARAGTLASGLGVNYDLCAAEDKFENSMQQWLVILREAFFIHWYFTAKYWAILIRHKATLKRIN